MIEQIYKLIGVPYNFEDTLLTCNEALYTKTLAEQFTRMFETYITSNYPISAQLMSDPQVVMPILKEVTGRQLQYKTKLLYGLYMVLQLKIPDSNGLLSSIPDIVNHHKELQSKSYKFICPDTIEFQDKITVDITRISTIYMYLSKFVSVFGDTSQISIERTLYIPNIMYTPYNVKLIRDNHKFCVSSQPSMLLKPVLLTTKLVKYLQILDGDLALQSRIAFPEL